MHTQEKKKIPAKLFCGEHNAEMEGGAECLLNQWKYPESENSKNKMEI